MRLPQTVSFAGFLTETPKSECHLTEGDSVTFYGAHSLSVIYVSLDDSNNNPTECIRVIPEFTPLQVRPLRPDLPKSKFKGQPPGDRHETMTPPVSSVIKLDQEEFHCIMSKIAAANNPTSGPYVEAIIDVNKGRPLPVTPPDTSQYDQIRGSATTSQSTSLDSQTRQQSGEDGYEAMRGRRHKELPPILSPSPSSTDGSHTTRQTVRLPNSISSVGSRSAPPTPQGHGVFFEGQERTSDHGASGYSQPTTREMKKKSRGRLVDRPW